MMLTFRAGKVLALAIGLSAIASCSREQQDWRSAEAADTVESYGQFLEHHPDSELVTAARARLAQLTEDREWRQAASADTPEAYKEYLAHHPDGKWAQEARIRIQNFALNRLPPPAPVASGGAAEAPTPVATASAPAPMPSAPTSSAAAAMPSAPIPTPSASAARPSLPPSAPAAAPATSAYAIQLGAFSSADAANTAWQQLATRFASELHGLSPHVVSANTPNGALFRLQAQVFDEPRARALCDMLRKQSQACVPVLPR